MPDRTPPSEVDLVVRFWARVEPFDVRDGDACALWLGHRLPSGYGTMTDAEGVHHYAHRVSWELLHGPIPDGHVVRHLCDRPECVRPGPLLVGTSAENSADKLAAGRARVLPPLTDDDIEAIRHCYATGRWSQGDVARMFLGSGTGQPIVQRIVTGTSYPEVGGPISRRGRGVPPSRRTP